MSIQYDLSAGFDPSSLTQLNQTELLQMINQASPLSNIGGIIYGTITPDVANNPRFARYIWLDATVSPPVPKFYDGLNWLTVIIAAQSITDAEVAPGAAIDILKLAFGTARYLIRTNAAGTVLEFINPNSIFANGDVPLTALDVTGAPGTLSLLQRSATGVISWAVFDPSGIITALPVAKLAPSVVDKYILQTVAGVAVWVQTNSFLTDLDVNLTKLASGGAASTNELAWDGAKWAPRASPFRQLVMVVGATVLPAIASATFLSFAHNLGVVPTYVKFKLRNTANAASNGFPNLAEIPVEAVVDNVLGGAGVFSEYNSDVNTQKLIIKAATNYTCLAFDGSGTVNLTAANWTPVGYFAV